MGLSEVGDDGCRLSKLEAVVVDSGDELEGIDLGEFLGQMFAFCDINELEVVLGAEKAKVAHEAAGWLASGVTVES